MHENRLVWKEPFPQYYWALESPESCSTTTNASFNLSWLVLKERVQFIGSQFTKCDWLGWSCRVSWSEVLWLAEITFDQLTSQECRDMIGSTKIQWLTLVQNIKYIWKTGNVRWGWGPVSEDYTHDHIAIDLMSWGFLMNRTSGSGRPWTQKFFDFDFFPQCLHVSIYCTIYAILFMHQSVQSVALPMDNIAQALPIQQQQQTSP